MSKLVMNAIILNVLLLGLPLSMATASDGEIVSIEPKNFFVPVGFDDNDQTVAVMDGYLPDTCYRLRPAIVEVDATNQKIVVEAQAVKYPGPCMDVIIPYSSVVQLGVLAVGNYKIVTKGGKELEKVEVKRATSPGPDEFLYAPVENTQVETSAGKAHAHLFGRYTNSCMEIQDIKVINSGKTIEVLPIMGKKPNAGVCVPMEVPYEKIIQLPTLKANERYLLHIRSLDGQSVNQVFTQRK